jgi:hypothetical protein
MQVWQLFVELWISRGATHPHSVLLKSNPPAVSHKVQSVEDVQVRQPAIIRAQLVQTPTPFGA